MKRATRIGDMSLDEEDRADKIDVILLCRTDGTLETVALFRLNNYVGTSASITGVPSVMSKSSPPT